MGEVDQRQLEPLLRGIVAGTQWFVSTAAGVTFLGGLLLIWRTRGFENVGRGEWGGLLLVSIVLTLAMMWLGGRRIGGLLRRADTLTPQEASRAGRLTMMLVGTGVLVLAMMTRMLYAAS